MAIRLKLGNYETVRGDPLKRAYTGYFPRMTEAEAWEAGRGVWRMSAGKVSRQKFALIVGEGLVRAVGQITGFAVHGDRIALEGHVLPGGHPVRDAYLGRPDPVGTGSQNPVGYRDLPEEQQFTRWPCHCGCGEGTDRDFLPGHDVRAMQARVREHFSGSPLKFIQWVDSMLAPAAASGGPPDPPRAAGRRARYQSRPGRRVLVPGSLEDLRGPAHGTVELPLRLFWSAPDRTFDLDDVDMLRSMYEKVLGAALRMEDLTTFLNGGRLADVWPDLFLPRDVRRAWEEQHPVLRRAPAAA